MSNIYFDSIIISQRNWNTIKFKYPRYIKRHILKMARIRPLVNACHRVPYLRQCLPTISGVRHFFSLLFAYSTSAYETHCRATGRWLGLLCFYTSLVISRWLCLSLSLAPSIPRPCCLRSSLAGRVKFTNPYGAPRATSAPVPLSHFKNPSCSFFSLRRVLDPRFSIVFHFFLFFFFNSVLFIYLFPSSSSLALIFPRSKIFLRLTCCPLSRFSIPTPSTLHYRSIGRYYKLYRAAKGCRF